MLPCDQKELLRQIAEGDEKAFRVFFDLYKSRFYSVTLKMTRSDSLAQEIVQEIFMKIWQNRSTLPGLVNPDSYFFTCLYRRIYRHYKKLALERKLLQVIAESPTFQNITDETINANESERLIKMALAKLPPQQQLVFKLSKQDGLSREQIAEKLQISPNTVRNHLAHAIQFIKSDLRTASFILFTLLLDRY
jgi:RNA polymerase sigma-70 factor (family 1)